MEKDNTLAMEMLHELKRSSKRKDIIIVVLIIALIVSNLAWLRYESQFEELTETEQVMEDIEGNENTTFNQEIN